MVYRRVVVKSTYSKNDHSDLWKFESVLESLHEIIKVKNKG